MFALFHCSIGEEAASVPRPVAAPSTLSNEKLGLSRLVDFLSDSNVCLPKIMLAERLSM